MVCTLPDLAKLTSIKKALENPTRLQRASLSAFGFSKASLTSPATISHAYTITIFRCVNKKSPCRRESATLTRASRQRLRLHRVRFVMEQSASFELAMRRWKRRVLPLHHDCIIVTAGDWRPAHMRQVSPS